MTQVLTQRSVEAAKPKAKRYDKRDGLIPGLRLVIQPSGTKTFRLIARINGKQENLTIGQAGVLSLAEAREEARRKLAMAAKGENPRSAKLDAARAASETVEVIARKFIERHVKPNTRRSYETTRIIERDILPVWGKRPISIIIRRDVAVLLDTVVDRGSPVMANRVFAVGRKMFSWAIERGLIETSPFDHVKRPASETKRDRTLDDRELALVWDAADRVGYPVGPAVQILILSGARRGEVCGMRWSELDRDLTTWTLPAERVKNGVQHQIPLAPLARNILAGLPRFLGSDDFVFTVRGKSPITRSAARAKQQLDAAIADPIAPWTTHDLRRTAATGMARLGVQLPVVEKILNHVSGSFGGVAGIYQRHDFADEKRQALEVWAMHVVSLDIKPPAVQALRA